MDLSTSELILDLVGNNALVKAGEAMEIEKIELASLQTLTPQTPNHRVISPFWAKSMDRKPIFLKG